MPVPHAAAAATRARSGVEALRELRARRSASAGPRRGSARAPRASWRASPRVEQRGHLGGCPIRGPRRPRRRPPRACRRRSGAGGVALVLDVHRRRDDIRAAPPRGGARRRPLPSRQPDAGTRLPGGSSFHAQDRDPRRRPHPDRQDGRRALDAATPPSSAALAISARARARRGGARAGRARHHRPGAAGRPGPDPLAPGADQGRDPQGGLLGDDQQGLRLGAARERAARPGDPRRRPARSAWAGAWSRCRRRPTCSPQAASATAWATPRCSTRWSTTASPTRSRASRCSSRRPRSATSCEMTRADLDRWALRSHELALKAIDDGRMSEEIVAVTIPNKKKPDNPTVVEIDEGPRRDTSLEALATLPPAWSARTARTRPATRPASTTAPGRWCWPPRSGPPPTASSRSGRSSPTRRAPTTSPTSQGRPPAPP